MCAQVLDPGQSAIDEVVTSWPDVKAKQVFGHRGWVHNGKLFGFAADIGVAVKSFAGDESERLYSLDGAAAFVANGMEMRAWPVLPIDTPARFDAAVESLRIAYDNATAT